jgi:DNA-binding NarL/FixJ family response regulator
MDSAPERKIRVALVDDHGPVRHAIKDLLAAERDIVVVGEAGTRSGALALADRTQPDVLLLDLQLPDGNGLTAIDQLLAREPEMRVVVLTMFEEPSIRTAAIEAGAAGYVLKDSGPQDVLEAVRATPPRHRAL